MVPFLVIDLAFFGANLTEALHGRLRAGAHGGGARSLLMWTWVKGTAILFEKTRKTDVPLVELVGMLEKSPPHRVKGTAVFLTSDPDTAPAALLHNLKHNKVLHEKNVILTVQHRRHAARRTTTSACASSHIGDSFWRVEMTYGYMETPNVPRGLAILRKQGFKFDIMATSFFLSRRSIRPAAHSGMPLWQDKLFIGLAKTRQRRDRLLPDPDRPRRRGRHAGDGLKAARPVLPARHPYPSSLPVIPARHPYPSSLPVPPPSSPAVLPTRTAIPARPSLPVIPALPTCHPCPPSLPPSATRHPYPSSPGSARDPRLSRSRAKRWTGPARP